MWGSAAPTAPMRPCLACLCVIVFRSFVEFKTAVKMLTIVQRSVDVRGNTGIFESKVSAAEETAPKKVNAISKIKVPKIMQ